MDNKNNDQQQKGQLIYTLAHYGAKAAKLSEKRKKKLEEWILAYLSNELHLGGSMDIRTMREYIDRWKNSELNEKDYKYYYVDKNSRGDSSLWERYGWEIFIIGAIFIFWIFSR